MTEKIDLNTIDIESIEFPDKIITFMDYTREMPAEMQASINSLTMNIAKLLKVSFMEIQKLPYEKAVAIIGQYKEQREVREEKAFLAKRSESS